MGLFFTLRHYFRVTSISVKYHRISSLALVALSVFLCTAWLFGPKSGINSIHCGLGGIIQDMKHQNSHSTATQKNSEYYFWAKYGQEGNIRQRLAEYVPYNPDTRWNRNVIQSWKTFVNRTTHHYFGSWDDQFPDFNHILYLDDTEAEYVQSISHNSSLLPDVVRTYSELLDMRILRSDFFRYLSVWIQGGIWADIDVYVTEPFEHWISGGGYNLTELALPIEELERKVGMIVGIDAEESVNFWGVGQSMFAAKKGHPVLLEMIARIVENAGDLSVLIKEKRISEEDILEQTGPGVIRRVVEEWIKTRYDSSFNVLHDLHIIDNIGSPTLIGDILFLPSVAVGGYHGGNWVDTPYNPKIYTGHAVQSSWRFEGQLDYSEQSDNLEVNSIH